MSEMEDKLNTVLSNPQLMQQIMTMAQSLGQSSDPPSASPPQEPALPAMDLAMVQKLSGLASQSGIDREQQALLSALSPYLSREKVTKLEKAMRAAKMASLASSFLNQGGLSLLTGR